MKEKKKVYIVVTKYKDGCGAIEEERLYLIEGKIYKQHIAGAFQKGSNVKGAMKEFASSAHVATVYLSQKELTVVKSKQGYFYFKEDVSKKVYNLRNDEIKREFLKEFF